MNNHLQMVRDFHQAFSYNLAEPCGSVAHTEKSRIRRCGMIWEEFSETTLALLAGDKVEVLDGLVDLSYFALGGLAESGQCVEGLESFPNIYIANAPWPEVQFTEFLHEACYLACKSLLQTRIDERLSYLYNVCAYLVETHCKVNFNEAFSEIQRSNMSKLGADGKPVMLASGKIGKGPDYSAPDLLNIFYKELS